MKEAMSGGEKIICLQMCPKTRDFFSFLHENINNCCWLISTLKSDDFCGKYSQCLPILVTTSCNKIESESLFSRQDSFSRQEERCFGM
jgi:hypothetical protein